MNERGELREHPKAELSTILDKDEWDERTVDMALNWKNWPRNLRTGIEHWADQAAKNNLVVKALQEND